MGPGVTRVDRGPKDVVTYRMPVNVVTRSPVKPERTACEARINELASDPRFAGRADELREVAAALTDDSNTTWTGIDLVSAFPADATVSIRTRHLVELALGVIAGASVFAPVAWTWFSLHRATQAYQAVLDADQENGRTFLAMWTTGFDGRLHGNERLVPMALLSFVLILCAVGCIVLHRMVAEFNVRREDKQASQAHRDLVSTLVTAQRLLNERRSDDPRFLEAAVERSVKQLNDAHEKTRVGIEALNVATQTGVDKINSANSQLTDAIAPLLASATRAGTDLTTAANGATAAEQQLQAVVSQVEGALKAALEQFGSAVTTNTTQFTTQTATALDSLSDKIGQVAAVHGRLSQEVAAVGEISRTATVQAAEMGQRATAALADASRASIADLSTNTRQAITELATALGELREVLLGHESALQAQATELSRVSDLAGQVVSEVRNGFTRTDGMAR